MGYEIEYLPLAKQDLRELVAHLREQYSATEAVLSQISELEMHIRCLAKYPYAHSLFHCPMKLSTEIRNLTVKNLVVYYTVREPQHIVEIRRMLYGRMDASIRACRP